MSLNSRYALSMTLYQGCGTCALLSRKRKKEHPSSVRHDGASRSAAPGHQQTFEGFIRCLTPLYRRVDPGWITTPLHTHTHTYTRARASHPLDIWSHFPLSAREPAPSVPAGILSHYRTHVSSIPSTASSCDAAWRHESSRLLGKQRRAVDEFMGNGGAGGGIERIGGKGKSRTRVVPCAEGVLVSSSRAHREATLWRRPMLIRC